MAAEVFLRRLSRWQAEQQRNDIGDVHVMVYRGDVGTEYRDREDFLGRFEQDVRRPDFDMVVAGAARLVGCAYGFHASRTGGWWSGFDGELPPDIEEFTASGRVFVLAELMVLPAFRRQGIATRLRERLLERRPADLAVTTLDLDGDDAPTEAAGHVLRAWGWSRLGTLAPGPGAAPREVWIHRPPG
ncbi:GNAT family N-acetyltransferase [Streptomyces avermitilis]